MNEDGREMTETVTMTEPETKGGRSVDDLAEPLRLWANVLRIWRLCGNASCLRARACRGNVRACCRRNYPLLPEGVRDWFAALLEAGHEGLSFAELKDYLEGLDEHEDYCAWIAAVRASLR